MLTRLLIYHALFIPLLVAVALDLVLFYGVDYRVFLAVILLAPLGMVGEVVFSYLWHIFYKVPIWDYNFYPIVGAKTSLLNPLPWLVGGWIFVAIERSFEIVGFGLSIEDIVILGLVVTIIYLPYIFFIKKRQEFANYNNYQLNFLPLIIAIMISSVIVLNPLLPILALAFGVIGFITEYIFGKIAVLAMGKRLWDYNHLPIDNNHTSLTNFYPFIMAGFYFIFWFKLLVNIL